jgi:toxin FitB
MSSFLIGTNVLSEYNQRGGPDAGVKRWLESRDRQSQYVSVISLAEIQKGIELHAEGKRRAKLQYWPGTGPGSVVFWSHNSSGSPRGRTVGLARGGGSTNREISAHGRLFDCGDRACPRSGHSYQNSRDFEGTGVTIINPWGAA